MIKNGVENMTSEKRKEWAGSLENYSLRTVNGKTELTVDMKVTDEYKDYFQKTWPKALDKLKVLAKKIKRFSLQLIISFLQNGAQYQQPRFIFQMKNTQTTIVFKADKNRGDLCK